MTIPHHFPLAANFPVYCLDWLSEDVLVYAGGGGKGRSGVGNYVRAIFVPDHAKFGDDARIAGELKLSSEEDAPMCIAVDAQRSKTLVLGINEDDETKKANNEHLRVVHFNRKAGSKEDGSGNAHAPVSIAMQVTHSAPSLPLAHPTESYLKRVAFSPNAGQLVSASTDGSYALHLYPSLTQAFRPTSDFQGEDIVDADFSPDGTQLVLCTGRLLKVFGTYPNPADPSLRGDDASSSSSNPGVSKTDATLQSNADAGRGPGITSIENDSQQTSPAFAHHMSPPPVWQTIQNPALGGEGICEFRAVRYGTSRKAVLRGVKRRDESQEQLETRTEAEKIKGDARKMDQGSTSGSVDQTSSTQRDLAQNTVAPDVSPSSESGSAGKLFTVVNAKPSGSASSRGRKGTPKRRAFLTSWSLSTWGLIETRQISEKPVTCFAISSCGRYLAYGSSDLSLGVINATTLRLVFRILDAHSFPPTDISFSPDGNWLVSASADNTLRVVRMPRNALDPQELGNDGSSVMQAATTALTQRPWVLTLLLSVFIVALALHIQRNVLSSS